MISKANRFLLRKLARDSIKYGLQHQAVMSVDLPALPPAITEKGASFVTLFLHGGLRGCIGCLEAHRSLAEDVAANAYAAAFRDHRFQPVSEDIVDDLDIHISVLSEAERIDCDSEQNLLEQLVPGQDGLIIDDGKHRATFLPAVWESLPNPERFVTELKKKAGLPSDYWSETMNCYRYRTESF